MAEPFSSTLHAEHRARFVSKIDIVAGGGDGICWLWKGRKNHGGYGIFPVGHSAKPLAHRFAWELHGGVPIPPGMMVRHLCDNPACVRPWHLRLSTQGDNMQDMVNRGRGSHKRPRPPMIPLDPAVARALAALGLPGELPQETLARIVWAFGTAETREREDPRAPRSRP